MITHSQKEARKKINFMVKIHLIDKLNFVVPAGKRSDFVNDALQRALEDEGRRRAIEAMDKLRKKMQWKISDEEIRKLREYGRK